MQNSTMKALVLTTANKAAYVKTLPIPVPKANEILVRVHAVALNPVDAVWVANPVAGQPERIVGLDFAGEIVELPNDLKGKVQSNPRLAKGARVSGFMQGGAFAEYIAPEFDLVWLIPDSMSYQQAATISACGVTAAQSTFFHWGLPCPFWKGSETISDGPFTVFLYGASTSVGLFAAQMVQIAAQTSKRAIKLIGAASTAKHAMLKDLPYGHDSLVDYRESSWPEQVRELTDGGVDFALDCVTDGETVLKTESVLKRTGKLVVVRGTPTSGGYSPSEMAIKPIYEIVFAALGHELDIGGFKVPRDPAARDFAVKFFDYLTSGAVEGKTLIQPNPVRQMPGGLEHIAPDGFFLLSSGVMASPFVAEDNSEERMAKDYMKPISAEKLVYTIV